AHAAKRGPPAGNGGGIARRTRNGGGAEAAAAPAATAVAPGETVERTLTAELPKQIVKDSVASLLVSLTAAEVAGGLPISLPVGTVSDILGQARRGLVVEGGPQGRRAVAAEDSLPFPFRLRAVGLGAAQLRVLAFRRGQALGALDLAPWVIGSTTVVT